VSDKEFIASRISQELTTGTVVNLGIGIPTMVAEYIPSDAEIFIHSENGILGVGVSPNREDEVDYDLVNAGKLPVTVIPGAAFFDSATSFGMIRGRHVDVAVLGILEIDERGRVANWAIPGQSVLGVGGAMDLLEGAKRVIVATTHTTKNGSPKLVKSTNLPLTSMRSVDLIVTDLAVFKVENGHLVLTELAPGVSLEEVRAQTEATFEIHLSAEHKMARSNISY